MDKKINSDFFEYGCENPQLGTKRDSMKHSIKLSEILPDYLEDQKREEDSAITTISTYRSRLNQYQEWLSQNGHPDADIATVFTTSNIQGYKYYLQDEKKRPRTVRGALNAIRSLGEYLVKTKVFPTNPAHEVKMPKKDEAVRLLISDTEIQALLDATEKQAQSRRVAFSRAVFTTLAFSGIRADELINIKVQDVLFGRNELIVVKGKGGKSRTLYPPPNFFVAMKTWLCEREKLACTHDYVWAHGKRSHMSYDWLLNHIEELKAIAGYKGAANIKPHSIRHWFATKLYSQCSNIKTVQTALGHSKAQTTFVYLHIDEEDARGMARLTLEPTKSREEPTIGQEKNASPDQASTARSSNRRSAVRRSARQGR